MRERVHRRRLQNRHQTNSPDELQTEAPTSTDDTVLTPVVVRILRLSVIWSMPVRTELSLRSDCLLHLLYRKSIHITSFVTVTVFVRLSGGLIGCSLPCLFHPSSYM